MCACVVRARDKIKAFMRQLDYLAYTIEANKTKFNSRNILVLEVDQFRTALLDNMHPNNILPRIWTSAHYSVLNLA